MLNIFLFLNSMFHSKTLRLWEDKEAILSKIGPSPEIAKFNERLQQLLLGSKGLLAGGNDFFVGGRTGGQMAGWPGGRMAWLIVWPRGRVSGWPDGRVAVAGWLADCLALCPGAVFDHCYLSAVFSAVFQDSHHVSSLWRQSFKTAMTSTVFDETLWWQPSLQQSLMTVFSQKNPSQPLPWIQHRRQSFQVYRMINPAVTQTWLERSFCDPMDGKKVMRCWNLCWCSRGGSNDSTSL